MSAFTAQEIATLQARLDKRLGPEFISTKPGPGGGQVAYLAAEKVIGLANEVFGFNGWSSSLHSLQIDFVSKAWHNSRGQNTDLASGGGESRHRQGEYGTFSRLQGNAKRWNVP